MEAAAASEVMEGPVITVISKRIRALRKKLNRISQMEDSISKGKTLNKEQEETLRSKPSVIAGIEELEKLRPPLTAAVGEEISLAIQRHQVSASPSETSIDAAPNCEDKSDKVTENGVESKVESMIEDLLRLLYYGGMFDVSALRNHTQAMYSKAHERSSCLSYDCMKDDDSADLLQERDLDLISMLSGLVVSRPVFSSLPHKHALEKCLEHAKLWLENSDQPIEPNTNVTYSELRLKLNKIIASQYSIASPVMNFGTYQVQVQELIPPVDVQAHAEDTGMQYQPKEEPLVSNNVNETNNGDVGEEHHREGEDLPGLTAETGPLHSEEGLENPVDVKEHVHRRPYNNNNNNNNNYNYNNYRGVSRGGRHRGDFNGRRGRGREGTTSYQNGGNSQYYDQPGNFRSRNFEHRGSGGRGGRGGGYYNNNNNNTNNHSNHRAYGGGEGGGSGGKYNRES